jgi:hypothetical protein
LLLPSAHRPGELVRLPVGTRLACEAVVGLIAIWSQLGEEGLRFRVVDGPSAGECVHLNEDGGPLDQFGLRLVRSGD